jgi:hypothetical protein
MKSFLSFLGLILTALLVVAVIGVMGLWVYWWFLGLFTLGAMWFSLPYWATFIVIVLIAWLVRPAFLVLALTGFIGWTWSLNWHWYTGLAVYLPTIAILLTSFISVLAIGIVAGVAQLWSNTRDGLRRRR